jgi:hypothetical protein
VKFQIPPDAEQRLKEWGEYFRDRRSHTVIGSAEGRYKRRAGDPDVYGWGETSVVQEAPKERNWILRAQQTNDVVMKQQLIYRWALTYAFVFPYLPRFVMLKCMRKFTGRRLSWNEFNQVVEIGKTRVYSALCI